jgi:serine/threonine protein kinase HipA of HipAB toxin-antitoxin module
VFSALFSIETENCESAHVTMTALAVGDATPSILALTALTEVEVGADAELADDDAPSAAFGGEQPTTRQDSARAATISALRI